MASLKKIPSVPLNVPTPVYDADKPNHEVAPHNYGFGATWQAGFRFDQSKFTARQHAVGRGGDSDISIKSLPFYKTKNAEWKFVPHFRDSYIDEAIRAGCYRPGSGAYRTRREFPLRKDDELDDNSHTKETAPRWKFSHIMLDRHHNNPRKGRKPSSALTPGPGAYYVHCFLGGDKYRKPPTRGGNQF